MKTGLELVDELFGEDEIFNLREIEYVDGVEEYEENLSYNEGWYNYYEVTFKYNGKKYSFEYREHTSDNVADTEIFDDSFQEVEDTITITVEEYNNLINRVEFLNCLKACGVDNWSGYGDAWEMYEEEE